MWMLRGDLGLEQLRLGILQVMPGLPGMLVKFYNCVVDARRPATLFPLALASISDSSSASRLIQTGEGRKRGGGAHVRMTQVAPSLLKAKKHPSTHSLGFQA